MEESGLGDWGVAQAGEDGYSGGSTLLKGDFKVDSEGGILYC